MVMAMLSVGIVEHYRLPYAINDCKYSEGSSSVKLSLLSLNLWSRTLRLGI